MGNIVWHSVQYARSGIDIGMIGVHDAKIISIVSFERWKELREAGHINYFQQIGFSGDARLIILSNAQPEKLQLQEHWQIIIACEYYKKFLEEVANIVSGQIKILRAAERVRASGRFTDSRKIRIFIDKASEKSFEAIMRSLVS